MKKIVASVGLVAVGASGLQAAVLPALTTESGKPWNVSATLRGFYDDNINTYPNNQPMVPGYERSSIGFEFSPGLEISLPMEQTTINFGYVYSMKYYENKHIGSTGNVDNTQNFHAGLNHAFSERYSLRVRDSFVIGQEPDMLRAGNTYNSFQYVSGNNLRNYGAIDFSAQLTPEFGLDLGYANTMYLYADDNLPSSSGYSTAGLLNDLDHLVHLDGRYQLKPQTIGIVGVQFRETDYTKDQPISNEPDPITGQTITSSDRNARSYYGYLGLDHNFRPDLTGSVRAGGRYTDYYNNPASQNGASPYAMASLKYTYLPESYFQFGGSYDYAPSSLFAGANNAGDLTLSTQAGTVFASLNHRIRPKLFGGIMGQYQNSTYYGGSLDGKADNFYLVGLNLRYQFTPNFSAEAGYNYDKLNTDAQSPYTRNRVYVGVTGSY
jgi:hypothetical protein